MTTEKIKSATADAAAKIHNGVDTVEKKIDASADAYSSHLASIETQLRDAGERILANAKEVSDAAGKQMRANPLAAFGVAFVAGIALARLLRR